MARYTYLWDFFGPQARPTAEHFERHLLQFIEREGLAECATGTRSEQAGHVACYVVSDEVNEAALVRALKPARKLEPVE